MSVTAELGTIAFLSTTTGLSIGGPDEEFALRAAAETIADATEPTFEAATASIHEYENALRHLTEIGQIVRTKTQVHEGVCYWTFILETPMFGWRCIHCTFDARESFTRADQHEAETGHLVVLLETEGSDV